MVTKSCAIPCRGMAVTLLLVQGALCAAGQPAENPARLPPSPGFRIDAAIPRADQMAAAWAKWDSADRDLEAGVFQLPMAEAQQTLGRSLGLFLDFMDARGSYAEAVAARIEKGYHASGATIVTLDLVFTDEIAILGANVAALQDRLALLRGSPDWLDVRRNVLSDLDRALERQSVLRKEMLAASPVQSDGPAEAISAREYRECERLLAESLTKLWTGYYQALAAAATRKPQGSVSLIPVRGGVAAPTVPKSVSHPMEGVWIYLEGSRLFNGAGEPRQVLLELWLENGVMLGRYRAQLPDFSGTRKVDLRLRGSPSAGGPLTLQIESNDTGAKGQIVLEGPAASGVLTLSRIVPAGGPVPRGREMLRRR